ncbi:terpene synthase family protein [Streptomyces sp. ISL-11]|uniref:terpene synthase family protein n=1 Tax=Streptomyces sp. ISL-11 TaxID=2819174 RepID=UPI001BEC9282|nr:terpene synthase family protein [Streptomyces sp. ISL-11]MBT2382867.1 terpene cyclase [Streptomyces sp. ISL-11]
MRAEAGAPQRPSPYGLDGITVPDPRMPVSPHPPSPFLAEADATVWSWLDAYGICQSPASQRNLRRARITLTTAMAYPGADRDTLARLARWLHWTFIMDDEFDDGPDGRDAVRCEAALTSLLRVLEGEAGRTPATRALADIWHGLLSGRSPSWRRAFRRDVEGWFWSYYEDTVDRAADHYPRLAAYRRQRARGVGAYMFLTLAELGAGVDLPETVRHVSALVDLRHAAAEYTGLNNDLWSVAKDRSVGVFHNAVMLIEHHERCTLQDAVDRLAGLLADCAERMAAARRVLPGQLDAAGIGGRTRADVLACAAAYGTFVRGCYDYYHQVDRYTRADPDRTTGELAPVHRLFTPASALVSRVPGPCEPPP